MKTKGKAWKLKNKGFTLIEMIVTVAIIAIFSGVVVTFIGTGSGVYRNTSSNSKVQMETQETFDKIEDLIIDANRSLYYANGSDSEIGAEIRKGLFLFIDGYCMGIVAGPDFYGGIAEEGDMYFCLRSVPFLFREQFPYHAVAP